MKKIALMKPKLKLVTKDKIIKANVWNLINSCNGIMIPINCSLFKNEHAILEGWTREANRLWPELELKKTIAFVTSNFGCGPHIMRTIPNTSTKLILFAIRLKIGYPINLDLLKDTAYGIKTFIFPYMNWTRLLFPLLEESAMEILKEEGIYDNEIVQFVDHIGNGK